MEEEKEEEKSQEEPAAPEAAATQPAVPGGAASALEGESALAELRKKLDEVQAASEVLRDQLLRKAAEFENYKRRTESEFRSVIRNANEGLILALIPVLDDFVRSLALGKEQRDYEAFYRGIELIYNKLFKILEQRGLAPFTSVGQPFNVEFHDALLQVPKEGVPPHTVIEEIERGYMLNDRVLRHAKVVVSASGELSAHMPTDGEEKQGSD